MKSRNRYWIHWSNSGWQSWLKYRQLVLKSLGICLGSWLVLNTLILVSMAAKPVDAFFVLGGSIRREMYVVQLAKQHPHIPILISQGSLEPCLLLLFQREQAPRQQVWLEQCAHSTFTNFYFGIPILRRWGVHKVRVITSATHLPRAQWLAQILLGAQRIWVQIDIVEEQGIPGNRESFLKTVLDVTRSLVWAIISQFYQPKCSAITSLLAVNLQDWQQQGFSCEHQGQLNTGGNVN